MAGSPPITVPKLSRGTRVALFSLKALLAIALASPLIYLVLTDGEHRAPPPEATGRHLEGIAGHVAGHLVLPLLAVVGGLFAVLAGLIIFGLGVAARGTQTLGERIASTWRGDPRGRRFD